MINFFRRRKILLLNDTRDQVNWGSEALVDLLLGIISPKLPRHKLSVWPSHRLSDPALPVTSVPDQGASFKRHPVLLPRNADEFTVVANKWLAGRGGPDAAEVMAWLNGGNLLIFNGEGSIYRQNYSAIKGLFITWLAATRLNIPCVFINGGVHLTRVDPILPAMVRKTFGVLKAVTVRDPYSLRSLAHFAPQVQARLVPDSAFHMSKFPDVSAERAFRLLSLAPGTPYICISGGMMQPDWRNGAKSAIHQLIVALRQLVPDVVILARAPDDLYLRTVASETGAHFWGPGASYNDLMAVLAHARFQLTGRYHHVILGAMVGCPAIAFAAASHKMHGLLELLGGLFGEPYDYGDLFSQTRAIVEQAQRYLDQGDALRQELKVTTAALGRASEELGAIVAGVLDQPASKPTGR